MVKGLMCRGRRGRVSGDAGFPAAIVYEYNSREAARFIVIPCFFVRAQSASSTVQHQASIPWNRCLDRDSVGGGPYTSHVADHPSRQHTAPAPAPLPDSHAEPRLVSYLIDNTSPAPTTGAPWPTSWTQTRSPAG